MATYGYKAITKAGKEVKGSLEADNKDLAMAELRSAGADRYRSGRTELPDERHRHPDRRMAQGQGSKRHVPPVRQHDQSGRQHPRIPENALRTDREQEIAGCTGSEVRISVEKGETLADSMAGHPKVFPAIMVNMVAAGEASGSLETAMDRVATQLEKSHKTQAMVKKQ